MLKILWSSTTALYERFTLKRTLKNTVNGISEECLEVLDAIDILRTDETNPLLRLALAQEVGDLMVVAIGALQYFDIEYGELEKAIQDVVNKNNKKTHETHVVFNEKITRRDKVANHFESD